MSLSNQPPPTILENSKEVPQPPTDSISSLSWSSKANYLVAGSWDNQVRCYQVQNDGSASLLNIRMAYDAPILTTCWNGDGNKVFSGGCDNKARYCDLATSTSFTIGEHQGPIKQIAWLEDYKMLATASWDKTLKYWDCRQSNPVLNVQLKERAYAMDINKNLCVVATAERQLIIYELSKPDVEFKRLQSPLKYQTRCVACFPDRTGFAVGSIEGRVGIQHVDDRDSSKNFAFKCHRQDETSEVYAVNCIAFHPIGTFATTGSDGGYNFWDKDSKQRLKQFKSVDNRGPIPVGSFNADGSLFAFALSYDWSKGVEYYNPNQPRNSIMIHTNGEEIKPKSRTARNTRR